MKEIVTDVSAIEDVLNDRCVYVDKTAYLHKLISSASRLFFISRPRRFGKSLMLSTLKAIFEGKKELFEGTAISKTDYDWQVYPVLHMDMSSVRELTVDLIREGLNNMVMSFADQLGLNIEKTSAPGMTFENLWKAIANKNLKVVVLVDEYDIPLQGFLNNPEAIDAIRQTMHDFYIRLKSYGSNIRFMMMTGVTKLTKLSVFSGLNNPIDLTMEADYAGMLGYTHEELETYFGEHIDQFAVKRNTTHQAVFEKMLEWYDNYRFSPRSDVQVLNPVSVGRSFRDYVFKSYWISTGRASMIVERLRHFGKLPSDLDHLTAFESDLDVCNALTMPLVPLLYQGGYLTIKDVDEDDKIYLGVPNSEVRQAIVYDYLTSEIEDTTEVRSNQLKASRFLSEGKIDEVVNAFRMAIAQLPYEWVSKGKEGAVKSAFAMFFYAMYNSRVTYEHQVLNGRADAIVETKSGIYVFEFKYNESAQKAYDQILAKKYYEPYLAKGKPIYGIGLNFNPTEGSRGVDEAVVDVIRN